MLLPISDMLFNSTSYGHRTWQFMFIDGVLGMTLNCTHIVIVIVTGSFFCTDSF